MRNDLHLPRAKAAWSLLVKRVRDGLEPFSYGELSNLVGAHPRSARYFLGIIQRYCDEHGPAPLQAFAVNSKTRMPGEGYHGSARTPADHAVAVANVRSAEWPLEPPNLDAYTRGRRTRKSR